MEIKIYKGMPQEALEIRIKVFVDEQGFVDEQDRIDKIATHLVMYDGGEPIATCRVFESEESGSFVLGRLCVLKEYRSKGIGSFMLSEAEKCARSLNACSLKLHSQYHAKAFYEKAGYFEDGEIELEQGKEHIWMKKAL